MTLRGRKTGWVLSCTLAAAFAALPLARGMRCPACTAQVTETPAHDPAACVVAGDPRPTHACCRPAPVEDQAPAAASGVTAHPLSCSCRHVLGGCDDDRRSVVAVAPDRTPACDPAPPASTIADAEAPAPAVGRPPAAADHPPRAPPLFLTNRALLL